MTPTTPKPRTVTTSTIKADLESLFEAGDESSTKIMGVLRTLSALTDLIEKAVSDVQALKASDTQSASQLTLVHDAVTQLTTAAEFEQMQAATARAVQGTSTKQAEILGSVVETLLDLADVVESVKGAVLGLGTQMQEQHNCPWKREPGQGLSTDLLIQHISTLAGIAPLIEHNVKGQLKERGFVVDPSTGQPVPREGIFRFWDRLQGAVVQATFYGLATGIISLLIFLYLGAKSLGERAKTEAVYELQLKTIKGELEVAQAEKVQRDQELKALKALHHEKLPR